MRGQPWRLSKTVTTISSSQTVSCMASSGARPFARLRQLYPSLPMIHLDDQSHRRAVEFPAEVPTLNKPFLSEMLGMDENAYWQQFAR
jgi:hypothetical protein